MLLRILLLFLVFLMTLPGLARTEENRISIRGSNLDIPRFVTIKTNKANMRTGPGRDNPIKWEYRRRGLPMKVVGEFDVWREVEDHEGGRGWMHRQTLSGKRMALVINSMEEIRQDDNLEARVIAVAEKGILTELGQCRGQWCQISIKGVDGWIRKSAIWGVLEEEKLE
jgi:SH3-like domain-containing protein